MDTDEELSKKTTKKEKGKTWFYIHFCCYLVVNIGLITYWWTKTDIPGLIAIMSGTLFGWGVGVVAHFIGVFFSSTNK